MVYARHRLFPRHDIDLRVDVLLAVELHLQLARANPLDELSHARLDAEGVFRLDEFPLQHAAEDRLDLRRRWSAFAFPVVGDLHETVNDVLVFSDR